ALSSWFRLLRPTADLHRLVITHAGRTKKGFDFTLGDFKTFFWCPCFFAKPWPPPSAPIFVCLQCCDIRFNKFAQDIANSFFHFVS
ncbi:hypothetical protein ACM28O_14075, partial [Lactiplantibacillus pentosus]